MRDKSKNRKGYKETKVGWIPEEWEVCSLLTVLKITTGQVNPRIEPYASMVLVAPNHIESSSGRLLIKETAVEQTAISGKYLLRKGDIIYSKIRPYLKKCIIADFDGLCSADMYPMTPVGNASNIFLLGHILGEHFSTYVNSVSVRSGIPKVNREELSEYKLALPPLPEQKAIASVLECWDKAIQKYEEKIEKKKNIKKGLMQKLLSGEQRLPGFDGEWEETRLGMMGIFSKGKGISRKDTVESGLPCIRYGEIYTTDAFVLNEFKSRISHETARLSRQIKKNDLLFACSGETLEDIGKSIAYMGTKVAYAGGDIVVFSPSVNKVGSDFLAYHLNTRGRPELRRRGQGQSVVHIYSKHLESIAILLPRISEQRAIASVLSSADSEIKALEKKLALLRDQKKYLLNNLVTGTIRLPEFCKGVG